MRGPNGSAEGPAPEPCWGALEDDQSERWERGERSPAEDYLQRLPPALAESDDALNLVYHEIVLRRKHGETPDPDDYCRRFPAFADRLREQFRIDRVLDEDASLVRVLAALAEAPPVGGPPSVPGYEILEELGRGGMAVVYKARDRRRGRLVALKMLLHGGPGSDPAERERFHNEALTAARLQHPNIVRVHNLELCDGRIFLVLEYVEGGPLTRRLDRPQPPREAARLLHALAGAVQHAHDRGVVHRDLKPQNILLTADGTPKVADFGLAKRADGDDQTRTGAVLGTPGYMAPEQAEGKSRSVGPAADVYALGAVLYALLAARPPFQGTTPAETMHKVVHDDPPSFPSLLIAVPPDLETICGKCLQKNPMRRYLSAAALAEDLRRFLDGRPIAARRPRWTARLVRWARRRPVAATAAAAAALLMLTVLAAVGLLWKSNLDLQAETLAKGQETLRADKEAAAARTSEGQAREQLEKSQILLHKDGVAAAWTALQNGRIDDARDALHNVPDDRRGWECDYLDRLIETAPRQAALVGLHDWGVAAACLVGHDRVASSGHDGRVVVWDAAGRGKPCELQSGVDSATALVGRHAVLRSLPDEDPPGFPRPDDCFAGLCSLHDGAEIAGVSLKGRAVLWDLRSKTPVRRELFAAPIPTSYYAVAASRDSDALLWGGDGGTLWLWKRGNAPPVAREQSTTAVYAVAALPSGRWIVGRDDGALSLLDADAARVLAEVRVAGPVWAVDVADDGRTLAVACGEPLLRTFRIDESAATLTPAASYEVRAPSDSLAQALHAVRANADGRFFAEDDRGALYVWDSADPAPRFVLHDQKGRMVPALDLIDLPPPLRRRAVFLDVPDGEPNVLLTAGCDTSVKRWDLAVAPSVSRFTVGPKPKARFDTTEKALLWVGDANGDLTLWDSRRGRPRHTLTAAHHGPIAGLDHAAGVTATCGDDGAVRFWEQRDGRIAALGELTDAGAPPLRCVSLSGDGRRVAVYGADDRVQVWDRVAPTRLRVIPRPDSSAKTVRGLAALDAEGKFLAVAGPGQTFRCYEVDAPDAPAVARDSIVVAGRGGTALLSVPSEAGRFVSGDSVGRLCWHPNAPSKWAHSNRALLGDVPVVGLSLTPGGARLAALAEDGTVDLVDCRDGAGRVLTLPPDGAARASDVLFDPTGRRLAVIHEDGVVVVREATDTSSPAHGATEECRWTSKVLLGDPNRPEHDLHLGSETVALDDAGRVWVLFLRPADDETARRRHTRPAVLGRETDDGLVEEALGSGDDIANFSALLSQPGEMLAAVRIKTQSAVAGSVVLFRRPTGGAPGRASGPEPFVQEEANYGYQIHLFPGPGGTPSALHFSQDGNYLYATSWTAAGENTRRVGRQGDGFGLKAAATETGLCHAMFNVMRFGQDPPHFVLLTFAADKNLGEVRRTIPDPGVGVFAVGLAADRDGSAVALYLRQHSGGGMEAVLARQNGDDWDRSVLSAGSALLPGAIFSNLVCGPDGTAAFAILDTDRCIRLVSKKKVGDWESELVTGQAEIRNLLVTNTPDPTDLWLRLDKAGRPVVVAARCARDGGGWIRVYRRKE